MGDGDTRPSSGQNLRTGQVGEAGETRRTGPIWVSGDGVWAMRASDGRMESGRRRGRPTRGRRHGRTARGRRLGRTSGDAGGWNRACLRGIEGSKGGQTMTARGTGAGAPVVGRRRRSSGQSLGPRRSGESGATAAGRALGGSGACAGAVARGVWGAGEGGKAGARGGRCGTGEENREVRDECGRIGSGRGVFFCFFTGRPPI
jgi:hypothetical protein